MRRLETERFSEHYMVREIVEADICEVFAFCRTNPFFYETVGGRSVTQEDIRRDMRLLPQAKHFWIKNSFDAIEEISHIYGEMVVAERSL